VDGGDGLRELLELLPACRRATDAVRSVALYLRIALVGRSLVVDQAGMTEFEDQCARLELKTRIDIVMSRQLREWVLKNRNRRWVPEWLLNQWAIEVDVNDGRRSMSGRWEE
jgi:hypothetical protein